MIKTPSTPFPPIACLGMSCRFPGNANTPSQLWDHLIQGVDAISPAPADRFDAELIQNSQMHLSGKSSPIFGGFLNAAGAFDAAYFGISPREARQMDPQQRLLLELALEAIHDAGLAPEQLAGTLTGVYVALSTHDYNTLRNSRMETLDGFSPTGGAASIAANRISHLFDFKGPSITVDTACSSSLVALHQACMHLRSGAIDWALVGAANMLLHPAAFVGFTRAGMLAPDGRCKAFDAAANGFGRAEGGGCVLLTREECAGKYRRKGWIRARILHSAINADGHTPHLSTPSVDAQASLLRTCYDEAGLNPAHVTYVEAHGTGTPVGDPAECQALGMALGCAEHRRRPLLIGSVKTHIGHLESASGMAGLIKAILVLQHGRVPANLHFKTPNPRIDFRSWNLKVVQKHTSLPRFGIPRMVGVSSFGFGGSNAHVVLQESSETARYPSHPSHGPWFYFASARSRESLDALAEQHVRAMDTLPNGNLHSLLSAEAQIRSRSPFRIALCATDPDALKEQLDHFVRSRPQLKPSRRPLKVAFLYSGNGSQWPLMAMDLAQSDPIFRRTLRALDRHLRSPGLDSLLVTMERGCQGLENTNRAQPLLFALQVAVTAWLHSFGIQPDVVLGHSVGEIAAAHTAGILTSRHAMHLVEQRSHWQHTTAGWGRMTAIHQSTDAVSAILESFPDIQLAAVNSPESVTVAGPPEPMYALHEVLRERSIDFKPLDLNYGFHSNFMDSIRVPFKQAIQELTFQKAKIPFVCCASGTQKHHLHADDWWDNIRKPVRFDLAMNTLLNMGCDLFLEVGPHPVLLPLVVECARERKDSPVCIPTLQRGRDGIASLARTVTRCFNSGYRVRFDQHLPFPRRRVELPTYPWHHQHFWFESSPRPSTVEADSLLGVQPIPNHSYWHHFIHADRLECLRDHGLDERPVLPAVAYLDMAQQALRKTHPQTAVEITHFQVFRPCFLDSERQIAFSLDPDRGFFFLDALDADGHRTRHAQGRVAVIDDITPASRSRPNHMRHLPHHLTGSQFYERARSRGLCYGPHFQKLTELWWDTTRACGTTRLSATRALDHRLACLDAGLQLALCLLPKFNAAPTDEAPSLRFLPVSMERVTFTAKPLHIAHCHLVQRAVTPWSMTADVEFTDPRGNTIARFQGVTFARIPESRSQTTTLKIQGEQWVRAPRTATHPMNAETFCWPEFQDDDLLPPPTPVPETLLCTSRALDQFGAQQVAHAWCVLGLPPQGQFPLHSWCAQQSMDNTHADYLKTLLRGLEQQGLARLSPHGFELNPPPAVPSLESLIRKHPESAREAARIHHVARALPHLLMSNAEPMNLVLPDNDSGDLGVHLLRSPLINPWLITMRHQLAHIITRITDHAPCRILELGHHLASSGLLLPGIDLPQGDRVVAHPNQALARRLNSAKAFHPNLTFLPTTELCGPANPTHPHQYDVIVVDAKRLTTEPETWDKIERNLSAGGFVILIKPKSAFLQQLIWGCLGHLQTDTENKQEERVGRAPIDAGFQHLWQAASGQITVVRAPNKALHRVDPPEKPSAFSLFSTSPITCGCQAQAVANALVEHGQSVHFASTVPGTRHLFFPADRRDEPAHGNHALEPLIADVQCLIDWIRTQSQRNEAISLHVITQGAARVPGDSHALNPRHRALWNMIRVLAQEHPRISCTLIDTSPEGLDLNLILDNLMFPDEETEIALRGRHGRWVNRVRCADSETPSSPGRGDCELPRRFRWMPGFPPSIRSLQASELVLPSPGPDEVEIEVHSVGLSFRDVMLVSGALPRHAVDRGFAGALAGMECSGIIRSLGSPTLPFRIGDPVMAWAPGALASHVVTSHHTVLPMPAHLSFAQAATMPVAYLTAWFAMVEVGRAQPGESILIHSATGGVGLAAVFVARHLGLHILATAGSMEKRQFLSALGIDHVYDSRSTRFADEVMQETQNQGVDLVLNALSGEAIHKNLQILKPFGRHLEIGKRDILMNSSLGLKSLQRNISFHVVDVDGLMGENSTRFAKSCTTLRELILSNVLPPLPFTRGSLERPHAAFRAMQNARHLGKQVLCAENPSPQKASIYNKPFKEDRTYLITGAFGGLGSLITQQLAARGARHLILVNGPRQSRHPAWVQTLQSSGVNVHAAAVDVGDLDQLQQAIQHATMPPIAGVIHGAMRISDRPWLQMTPDDMRQAWTAKATGMMVLDQLSRTWDLDFFVALSSATTLAGLPGMGLYVAANGFVEALIQNRRALGLPASAVLLGPIAEFGFLARNPQILNRITKSGFPPMTGQHAIDAVFKAMNPCHPRVVEVTWDPDSTPSSLPRTPRLKDLQPTRVAPDSSGVPAWFNSCPASERETWLRDQLQHHIAAILDLPLSRVSMDAPLSSLGMDSLIMLELSQMVESQTGITLQSTHLAGDPSVTRLAKILAQQVHPDRVDEGWPASSHNPAGMD